MIDPLELEPIVQEVIQLSYKAGEAILEIYNTDFEEEYKQDDSPLTKADLASNEIICNGLKKLTPEIPIISEENKTKRYEERKDWSSCWVVDPLDGTKEFVKKNDEFTTNVALIKDGKPIAGVVYIPVYNQMYYAIKGYGAYKIDENNELTVITSSSYNPQSEKVRIVCSRSHLNEATQAFVDWFRNPEIVSKGSSLKFLAIAEGEADVYPRLAPTMEWDTAAAQIILQEAGGSVTDFNDKTPLIYNKEDLLNPYFVAKGKEIST